MAAENDRFSGMLGLAMRAGRVIVGTEQICTALPKRGRVRLVLISDDASDNTKKKLTAKCEFYGVASMIVRLDTEELGRLLGKTYTPAAAAVTDENFAKELTRLAGERE